MASSVGSLNATVELKCTVDKFWEALKIFHYSFPKFLPNTYTSIEVLQESKGENEGYIVLIKYNPSTLVKGAPVMMVGKKRIENVDELNKTISYSVIDGDLLKLYKSFKSIITLTPKTKSKSTDEVEDQGSTLKWSVQFEKVDEMVPDPYMVKEWTAKTMLLLDAQLHSDPKQ